MVFSTAFAAQPKKVDTQKHDLLVLNGTGPYRNSKLEKDWLLGFGYMYKLHRDLKFGVVFLTNDSVLMSVGVSLD
jgi:hypothetical protein